MVGGGILAWVIANELETTDEEFYVDAVELDAECR